MANEDPRLKDPRTKEVLTGLTEILVEITGVPKDDVELDKSFTDDLDIDSLSMVEVVVAAEERFNITISDEQTQKLKTVNDAVSLISAEKAAEEKKASDAKA